MRQLRQFIERWYGKDGVAFDVVFDQELARFDVLTGELVVFSHTAFVEVLRWCMGDDAVVQHVEPAASGVELSAWDPKDD